MDDVEDAVPGMDYECLELGYSSIDGVRWRNAERVFLVFSQDERGIALCD